MQDKASDARRPGSDHIAPQNPLCFFHVAIPTIVTWRCRPSSAGFHRGRKMMAAHRRAPLRVAPFLLVVRTLPIATTPGIDAQRAWIAS